MAEGVTFTTALTLSETVRERLIVATSLTKTFNVPGVIVSYMIVPDRGIRSRIAQTIDRIGMHNPTIFAVAAVEHGYMECEEWYRQMLAYVNENETFTREFFAEHFPEFEFLKDREHIFSGSVMKSWESQRKKWKNGSLRKPMFLFIWEVYSETRAEALSV